MVCAAPGRLSTVMVSTRCSSVSACWMARAMPVVLAAGAGADHELDVALRPPAVCVLRMGGVRGCQHENAGHQCGRAGDRHLSSSRTCLFTRFLQRAAYTTGEVVARLWSTPIAWSGRDLGEST